MQYIIEAKETLTWLHAEKQYYDQLLSKLNEQAQAIDDEDETGLLIIIADKNRLIEEIAEIDQKLAEGLARFSASSREKIVARSKGLVRELTDRLHKIVELENACEKKLKKNKTALKGRLGQLKQGRALLKGYEPARKIAPKISRNV